MPERLWREALLVARELGSERVAESLALSPSALLRRLRALEREVEAPEKPVFLELRSEPQRLSEASELEILGPGGTRVTLRFQGPLERIGGLLRSVLERTP